jgi:hypothetical protein
MDVNRQQLLQPAAAVSHTANMLSGRPVAHPAVGAAACAASRLGVNRHTPLDQLPFSRKSRFTLSVQKPRAGHQSASVALAGGCMQTQARCHEQAVLKTSPPARGGVFNSPIGVTCIGCGVYTGRCDLGCFVFPVLCLLGAVAFAPFGFCMEGKDARTSELVPYCAHCDVSRTAIYSVACVELSFNCNVC